MRPRQTIILVESSAKPAAASLEALLNFFGVAGRTVFADAAHPDDFALLRSPKQEAVLFASATGFLLAESVGLLDVASIQTDDSPFKTVLIYAGAQPRDLLIAYARLFASRSGALSNPTGSQIDIRFSGEHTRLCGPFSGLAVAGVSSEGIPFLSDCDEGEPIIFAPAISNAAALLWRQTAAGDLFLSTSTAVLKLGAVTKDKFFDIKKHLFELLPFIFVIKSALASQIYKADAVKACLIVDDPRLSAAYGHFSYKRMLAAMDTRKFTTCVGFIPWNYRWSDRSVVDLVKLNLDKLSLAVHGCDHTGSEFGTMNASLLDWLAQTACSRMEALKELHGLSHDKVMIFPQGVFSAESLPALKRHDYWAAVNTDISATNDQVGVAYGDLMDLAITKYGGFPIISRRYLWHGLENFAFDLLLEKPCLIVTHHQDYRDSARQVLDGLDALMGLYGHFEWATLGNVVQTLIKRRRISETREFIRIYSHVTLIKNQSGSTMEATCSKVEANPDLLESVLVDGKPAEWTAVDNECQIACPLRPAQTVHLQFTYKKNVPFARFENTLLRRSKVALRRCLTEIRDRYLN